MYTVDHSFQYTPKNVLQEITITPNNTLQDVLLVPYDKSHLTSPSPLLESISDQRIDSNSQLRNTRQSIKKKSRPSPSDSQ